jgi:hypothetical protein
MPARHHEIDLAGMAAPGVAGDHFDLAIARKRAPSALGQSSIDLDRMDGAMAADQFGENRAVVSGAGADVQDMLARSDVEVIDAPGPEARAAVVEPAIGVDAHGDVMVDVTGVGVGRREVVARWTRGRAPDVPRPWPEEALPRHAGECLGDGRIAHDRRREPKLFGKRRRTTLSSKCGSDNGMPRLVSRADPGKWLSRSHIPIDGGLVTRW